MSPKWPRRPRGAATCRRFAVLLYVSGFVGDFCGLLRSSRCYAAATRFKPNAGASPHHHNGSRLYETELNKWYAEGPPAEEPTKLPHSNNGHSSMAATHQVDTSADKEPAPSQHPGDSGERLIRETNPAENNVASFFDMFKAQLLRQQARAASSEKKRAALISQLQRPEGRPQKELFDTTGRARADVGSISSEQSSVLSERRSFKPGSAEESLAEASERLSEGTRERGSGPARADCDQAAATKISSGSKNASDEPEAASPKPFSDATFPSGAKEALAAATPPLPVSPVLGHIAPAGATVGPALALPAQLTDASGTAAEAASRWEELSRQHQQVLLARSLTSVIKLFVDFTHPDHLTPWQMQPPRRCTGSAFVVDNRLLLTNGHLVDWQTRVLARRHGNARKFKASVVAVGHDCDLALLTVDNEEFWEGLQPLAFGQIPQLRDTVTLLGYPTGGDQLSITEGVVSRVGMSKYVHSSYELLTVQIDAAINPGNSGGPALVAGKVVGVAFQGFSELQSIGYIVPYPVVRHFLNDLALHNRFTGFPTLGIKVTNLENQGMKEFKKLTTIKQEDLPEGITPTGVVVVEVDTLRKERYLKGLMRLPYASTILPPEAHIMRLLAEDPSQPPKPLRRRASRPQQQRVAAPTPETAVSHASLSPPLGMGTTLAVPASAVAETGGTLDERNSGLEEQFDQQNEQKRVFKKRQQKGITSENDLIVRNFHYNSRQPLDEELVGLEVGDVLLAIDGIDVADDGTVPFRDMERNQLEYTLMNRFNGEIARALVLRDGKLMNVSVPLTLPNLTIPPHTWEMKPKYFVFGGLVFVQLTKSLVEHARHMEIPAFAYALITRMSYQEKEKDEIIVLSVILPSELTIGYSQAPSVVRKVQGERVRNFEELVRIVEECTDAFLEFIVEVEACKELPIVMDRKKAVELRQQIQEQHGISRDRSLFL